MFCLVDNDPYGLCIYGVYKHGGGQRTSAIERERLSLPGLRFLGIEAGDFEGGEGGLMELTERDRSRCEGMMRKEWVLGDRDVLYVSFFSGG
jgi:DNA topoisomerase VI subunit A